MAGSRLGFRGVEDLGGGLKAGFWLEGADRPDTGAALPASATARPRSRTACSSTRRSTVSLSNQWGEIAPRPRLHPDLLELGVIDPFGNNGVGCGRPTWSLSAELRGIVPVRRRLRHAGARQQHGAVHPAEWHLRPRSVRPGDRCAAGENGNGNKYFGGRIGYAAGPFDVAVGLRRDPASRAGRRRLRQLEHRRLVELRLREAVGLLRPRSTSTT